MHPTGQPATPAGLRHRHLGGLNSPIYVELGFAWQRQQAESLGRVATAKEGGEGPPEPPPRGAEALTEPLPPPAAAALSTRRSRAASCVLRRGSLSVCEKNEIYRNQAREGAQPSAPAATWVPRCRREKQPRARAPGVACVCRRAAGGAGRERLGLPGRAETGAAAAAAAGASGGSGSALREMSRDCARAAAPPRPAGEEGGEGARKRSRGPGGGRVGGERSLGEERGGSLPPSRGRTPRARGGDGARPRWARREDGERSRAAGQAPTAHSCPAPAPAAVPGPAPGALLSERHRQRRRGPASRPGPPSTHTPGQVWV